MRPHLLAITANPELGQLLVTGLPLFGFQACLALPDEALGAAHAMRPDAILLDIGWNTAAPLVLCEHLRALAGLEDVPILFFTTDARPARWVDALTRGADDLVLLPVQFTLLAERLRFHVSLARARARARLSGFSSATPLSARAGSSPFPHS